MTPTGLDFWVGEWDCTFGEGIRATNTVTKTLDGQVIQEDFRSPMLNGHSVSVHVPSRGTWLQTWVDDKGGFLVFEGGPAGDRFVLDQRPDVSSDEAPARMVFSEIEAASLVWEYQRRDEAGGWRTAWRIAYRRSGA